MEPIFVDEDDCSDYVREFFRCLYSIEASAGQSGKFKKIKFSQAINRAVFAITDLKRKGGSLFFVGNGGSAAIAGHQATDFIRSCEVRAFAPMEHSLLTCMANDFGYENVFAEPLKTLATGGDILIAISSSGQSKNILNAVSVFIQKKCRVITLSGFKPDNPLRFLGDINFYVPSDSYRFVESAHQFICDCILDFTILSLKEKVG